jgi:hypothetical protein
VPRREQFPRHCGLCGASGVLRHVTTHFVLQLLDNYFLPDSSVQFRSRGARRLGRRPDRVILSIRTLACHPLTSSHHQDVMEHVSPSARSTPENPVRNVSGTALCSNVVSRKVDLLPLDGRLHSSASHLERGSTMSPRAGTRAWETSPTFIPHNINVERGHLPVRGVWKGA